MLEPIVKKMTTQAKQLFLVDGLGALLSAFLLGVVLVRLEPWFGMPPSALYFLAFLPCCFAVYDFYCYWRINHQIGAFLKGIAYANLTYCVISIGFAVQHYQQLTALGWMYFIGEIAIVLALVLVELKVASRLNA